jgi:hypothetical protein
MKNKTYLYIGKPHRIVSYRCNNGVTYIGTDKDVLEFETDKLIVDLDKLFVPTAQHDIVLPKSSAMIKLSQATPNLVDLVMDSINQVRQDESHIPKANAIYKGVNTLINMMKLELQVLKLQERD